MPVRMGASALVSDHDRISGTHRRRTAWAGASRDGRGTEQR